MAKKNRGKILHRLPARGRGKCPICGKTRIKLLYSHITEQKLKVKVCKNCRNK